MTETDRDRMPKIKGMPQDQIDAILALRKRAEIDPSPRVKRPRPDFEALNKRYNYGSGDEMAWDEISIEDLELLGQEAAERRRVANNHPAENAPDA